MTTRKNGFDVDSVAEVTRLRRLGVAIMAFLFAFAGALAFILPQAGEENPPLGPGFWKNHLDAWKLASLVLGTTSYTKDQALTILKTPAHGDARLMLAHQLIVALLNIANGTDASPVSAAADVAIPVLVNDQRVELPAVHVRYSPNEYTIAQFYFLDYPENPLTLAWQLEQNGDRLQVVKISFPGEVPTPQIEQQLATTGRVEVHGIYFDCGSAEIRPESVLKEITDTMAASPTWKLSVAGPHGQNRGRCL